MVKDYGPRAAPVRRLLAPLLVRRELALLERLEGLPGVPRPLGRVGPHALAMEYVEGLPLRRQWFPDGLPAVFFDALEGILAGLAERGVAYLDLRSPTNVLCTPSLGPALVDLMSGFRAPLPRALLRHLEGAALEKLRGRFESQSAPAALCLPRPDYRDLKVGALRLRLLDFGRADDPVPALFLHDVGLSAVAFRPALRRAEVFSRRGLAVDLPGFGGSGRPRWRLGPATAAARLRRLLDALRIGQVDLVGDRWGGFVARLLAARSPERVRSLVTFDAPLSSLERSFLSRWREARRDPEALRDRIEAEIPAELPAEDRERLRVVLQLTPARSLRRAYGELSARPARRGSEGEAIPLRDAPLPICPWLFVTPEPCESARAELGRVAPRARALCWERPLGDPDRVWKELEALAGRTGR